MSRTFYRAPGLARARLPRARAQDTVNRVVALRRPAKLPETLTVHARFHCQRWHALCADVTVNDYSARLSAVYAAAQEAWGRLLGHGVLLRRIALQATADADVFVSRLRDESEVAA